MQAAKLSSIHTGQLPGIFALPLEAMMLDVVLNVFELKWVEVLRVEVQGAGGRGKKNGETNSAEVLFFNQGLEHVPFRCRFCSRH